MLEFNNSVAFVTGAASGIGLALCRKALAEGMNVMMADVESEALDNALNQLATDGEAQGWGDMVASVVCDVSKQADLDSAAQACVDKFGGVHLVVNNAGVTTGGLIDECSDGDWQWALSVNLWGTLYGVRAFLPIIRRQKQRGHFVNSSSMAGLVGGMAGWGPYQTSKYGIIGLTEVLRAEGRKANFSASALCAGNVDTQLLSSQRNRAQQFGSQVLPSAVLDDPDRLKKGMSADRCADITFAGIRADRKFIFTHPQEYRPRIEQHHQEILDDFRWAEQTVADIP